MSATGKRDWDDPMAAGNQGNKYNPPLPVDSRGLGGNRADMPEWKKHITAGGKASYGKKTSLSIIEQRQSLPIFGLKGTRQCPSMLSPIKVGWRLKRS